jgi:dihydroorotate dehydrogenase electron transfer subunit
VTEIIENRQLNEDFWLMKTKCSDMPKMGQFYMIRSWDQYPLLSRPISVFDADENTVSFLYKVIGQGTKIFSELKPQDQVELTGPLGNSFPEVTGKVAMVGGGVGIAPLYLAAKTLKQNPNTTVDLFLGFSGVPVLEEEYRSVSDHLDVKLGGYVTDDIEPKDYDAILTCGPGIMMKVLYAKCRKQDKADALTVSMESRMGCGIGACLGCSIHTTNGMRRVCKDGPVFKGNEVFENE